MEVQPSETSTPRRCVGTLCAKFQTHALCYSWKPDEILVTTLCLEQKLNARLLVPGSSDATDLDALTPNQFLLQKQVVEVRALP